MRNNEKMNFFKTILTFIGMLSIVCSCQQEQDAEISAADMAKVLEARDYFENDVVPSMPGGGQQVRLYPGILSPTWATAKVVETETSVITSVSFNSQFWFKAKRKRLDKSSEAVDYTVKAWQKFIIIKDKETEKFGGYFVTLIPDRAYYKANKNFKAESYAAYGNRLDFTGKEVYTTMTEGKVVSVNIIRNGEQVASASLACPEKKLMSNANKISKALNGITFIQRTHAITRGIEDDNWLDEVIITPDEPYDWGLDDDWWRDPYPPYEPDYDYDDDDYWDNDYPDNSDSGNQNNNSNTPEPKEPEPKENCNDGEAKSNLANNTMSNVSGVDNLRNKIYDTTREWGANINYSSNTFSMTNLESGTSSNSFIELSQSTVYSLHTHNGGGGGYTGPSVPDIQVLLQANNYFYNSYGSGFNLRGIIIFAHDGSEYLVSINKATAAAFYRNNSAMFNYGSDNFFSNTQMANEFKDIQNNLSSQGYSKQDSFDFAMTYMLDKYNTGINVAKKSASENAFKEMETSQNETNNNFTPKKCE